ncbi:MAG: VWA domain-containing protein [Lachnospiraceae bacterium]|nr:VWA domain-containing protein [Lachnospiraceae bacterium]
MKDNLTELVFILDRSGSMGRLTSDTIGGFNSMIEKQKAEPGEAVVTTVLFDNRYEVLHDHVPLAEIKPMTSKEYFARGTTALLDAVGMTINTIGARLNATPEAERPGKVIIVITTDGLENASHEYSRAQVKDMITHQQEKYSWNFLFLGANMSAVKEAGNLGIDADFARTYTASSVGTHRLFAGVSATMSAMRKPKFNRNRRDASYTSAMDALDEAGEKK